MKTENIYAGLSHVQIEKDVSLGDGIYLRKTYAHLMMPKLMAFKRAEEGKHHPPPWKAAKGSEGVDVNVELVVPKSIKIAPPEKLVWWVAVLLRLINYPYLKVSVISNLSFSECESCDEEPLLQTQDIGSRILTSATNQANFIDENDLEWIKQKWKIAYKIAEENQLFETAIDAWDYSTVMGRTSSSLIAVWAALEHLFSPSPGELKYRVSSNIAAYLEPAGPNRYELFKKISKLYKVRSDAAHTTKNIDESTLIESCVILRNALIKILSAEKIPTQEMLEKEIFYPGKTLGKD